MRSIAILLSLTAAVASAQQSGTSTAPPEPTPPPIAPAPANELLPPPPPPPSVAAPTATGPAESPAERAIRYSRFSAGPGGPLLAFTAVISGVVSGALIGNSYDKDKPDNDRANNAYTGAVVGGLTLGTVATMYQYFVPVERNEAFLAAGAAATGFLAGIAIGVDADLSAKGTSFLSLATTQAGIITVLAITQGPGDVSNGDAALVGMVSLYAMTLVGLSQGIVGASSAGDIDPTPTLVAPAAGMALGALLTMPLEMDAARVVKLTLIPLGVGSTMLVLGSSLAEGPTVPLTALAGIITSFALTFLLTSDPGVPTQQDSMRRSDLQAMPVPVVLAAGRDKSSIAAGPGLFLRF